MGNHMDKVMDGLYVGGFLGAKEKDKLKENKITHILSIHDTAEPQFPDDFMYKCIRIADSSNSDLSVHFSECVDFIHDSRLQGGAVFVHCAAGISRSVTITTLYVMCVSSLGMEESLSVVRFCRDIANPNFGFRMQLKKFAEEQLEKERKRILDKFPESHRLKDSDERHLQDTLKKAKEKARPDYQSDNAYVDFISKKSD